MCGKGEGNGDGKVDGKCGEKGKESEGKRGTEEGKLVEDEEKGEGRN